MKQPFVICIRKDDYPASLEKRKLYVKIHDPEAEKHHYVRVIDESGEDYLYHEGYFVAVELSDETWRAIMTDLTAQELRKYKNGGCPNISGLLYSCLEIMNRHRLKIIINQIKLLYLFGLKLSIGI